ncbi:unnamed protein product, partial [Ectocarpus sp. 8 AP-2014]
TQGPGYKWWRVVFGRARASTHTLIPCPGIGSGRPPPPTTPSGIKHRTKNSLHQFLQQEVPQSNPEGRSRNRGFELVPSQSPGQDNGGIKLNYTSDPSWPWSRSDTVARLEYSQRTYILQPAEVCVV